MSGNPTSRRVTRLLPAMLMASLIVLHACSTSTEPPELPVPPVLSVDDLDADAQEQIRVARERFEAAPELAQSNADIAMLLHTYVQAIPASVFYERARLLGPEDFRWAYLHALVLTEEGRRDEAIAALRAALDLDEAYVPAAVMLADRLAEAGELDKSEDLYQSILARQPELAQAQYGLGQVRLQQQRDDEGVELLLSAATGMRPYAAANYALAGAYRKQGRNIKADEQLALFERNRGSEPPLDDPVLQEVRTLNLSKQGLLARALEYYVSRQFVEAAETYALALEKDPENASAHTNLIAIHAELGEPDQSEAHYRRALAIDPDRVEAHTNFGLLRLKQKRYTDAEAVYRAAIAADPAYGKGYIGLGTALEAQGRSGAALDEYRNAVAMDPDNRQAGFYLGRALAARGRYLEASEQLRRIVEIEDAATAGYLQALALALAGAGRFDDAATALERGQELARKYKNHGLLRMLDKDEQRLHEWRKTIGLPAKS